MQVSREIPEEVKNQVIDGKKRVVTVVLPKKQKDMIAKKKEDKGKLVQKFFQISASVTKGQRALHSLSKQMEDLDSSIGARIQEGFKKLKLNRQKDRHWRFDGNDSFIGVYNPPPKKKEQK